MRINIVQPLSCQHLTVIRSTGVDVIGGVEVIVKEIIYTWTILDAYLGILFGFPVTWLWLCYMFAQTC